MTGYETTPAQTGGYGGATRDLRPNKEVSVIFEPNNNYALAKMTETIYDSNSDPQYFASLNPKQVKTYNYIVLDLTSAQTLNIEQISALFSNLNLASVAEMDYLYDTNYKARNLAGLITETRVKDAAGNVKAKNQISYDQDGYLLQSTGTMPTIASNSWVDLTQPSELGAIVGSKRGLPTTVRSYTDIGNNQYFETHSFYDQFSNIRKVRDGNGNDTETQYSADYAFAYPTLVKTPKPDLSGQNSSNTELITTSEYNYNTALLTKVTDANGLETRMEYVDALLRLTKVSNFYNNQQVGARTETEYGAGTSDSTRFVKVKRQIDEVNWKQGYTFFDGLGRTVKTQTINSDGDIFTETEYDNMSRVKKVSNPYRTGETIYKTESFYDDLSRVTKVKTPDNAEVLTAYSLATSGNQIGTTVTVTDQAGKLRRSITNALGQLIRVDELNDSNQLGAIDSPTQPTTYGYDVLNNLIQVQQIGATTQQCGGVTSNCSQTRTFVYDALSRLKSVTNPEFGTTPTNGTITYSYDNNSNLTQKIDAKNITTIYGYDTLNRIKTRNYSDGITPPATYYYDNLPNAKGKLIKVVTGTVSNPFSVTEYTSFDSMGRVTGSRQTTDGTAYNPMTYTYNLSGALIEETYPSGRVVKSVLDNDGEISMVQSKKDSNYGYFNYAEHFIFTAAGSVSSMQLGNGRWESTQFNSRLQPTQIALGTTQSTTNLLKLDYSYGTTNNNGNILSQTITVPTVGASPGFTAVHNYSYDSLNRLQQADEKPLGYTQTQCNQNPTYCWKQTFTYDRFGNRRFDQSNTTFPIFSNTNITNPTIDPTNNRFTTAQGYTYDLNGNILTDAEGKSFSYDAENKQKSVSNASGTLGQYFYDSEGKSVKKYIPATGETTIFIYDASGKMVAEYSTVVEPSATAKVNYLTNDHLGSPRIITDQNGQTINRRDFMPFGEEIYSAQRTTNLNYIGDNIREKFATYERDSETDLDFAKNRYFDSGFGRFSSPDPALESAVINSPQSWNRYVYVENNPLKYIDPLGLWKIGFATLNGKRVYVFIKTKEKDNAESLLTQLGFDPKDKNDKKAQTILKAISDSIITQGDQAIAQLSTIGNALKGGDYEKYGTFLVTVEEKMVAQEKHTKEGKKGGPEDDAYYDCALTTSTLAFPKDMQNKNKDNFGVKSADALVTDQTKASEIGEKSLRMLDVVRYGSGERLHFGNVLFKDDDGKVNVFSRLGENGPFDVHPINAKEVTKAYGSVSGRFRPLD